MFYSIMAVLQERLPCSKNFFRMKKLYRSKLGGDSNAGRKSMSPHRTIASPSMVKGLSSFSFKKKKDLMDPGTPTSGGGPSRFLGSRNPSRKNS
jgi:hypothetical protein